MFVRQAAIINRRFIICEVVKNRNFIRYFMEIKRQRRHWHIDVFVMHLSIKS